MGVPLAVLLSIAALVLYSARALLWRATDVWVAPVLSRHAASSASGAGSAARPAQVLVQAPGWVEADPYAISVTALTEGVVSEVLVLEGQRVQQGDVVARLVNEDAKLALSRSEAELEAMESELMQARANVYAAEARAAEVRDEVERKRPLVQAGGISEGQFARLEIRLRSMDLEVESAKSAVKVAQAKVRQHELACEEAELALSRTEVRSPSSGVVLARLVEPGTRISMNAAAGMPGAIVRLYDPQRLQVRVDVPIAEAAKVGMGTPAQIVTEAMPDTVFKGVVTRLVHEANIQRNTVQVKVAIENPSETLKPEMLTRVRFMGQGKPATGSTAGTPSTAQQDSTTFLVPAAALLHASGGVAHVFIVDRTADAGAMASMRQVSFTPAMDGYVEAQGPLHEGDRVIIEPLDRVRDGGRVRVLGEKQVSEQGGPHATH
ncbi:MAG TPA: efflux RND transporter periplasmic adaptor subunit [Phycisphaerales bacterium]|nr:efflux RND transporter periplasmic adaptor subunit [Phycisphaerales bacterium]